LTAIEEFSKAIMLDPQYAEAYLQRGACRALERNDSKAMEDFNKAIELKADLAEAYSKRGTVLCDQDKMDAGQSDLEKAVSLDPKQADAQYLLGVILLGVRNEPTKALVHLDLAADLEPNNASVFEARALAHQDLGNAIQAANDRARATKLKAENSKRP
jgi:tetratricopeptide (TPR) repeat protein